MPNNTISIDGTGKFQQSTENAGAIKYGEFSQVSINTGNIAVSALFTGSAVNSGTIGNYLPFATSVLVQTNSANWDAAFDAMNDFVLFNDARLTDAREPLSHTQAISTIDGLQDVLAVLEAGVGQGGAIAVTTSDISDFNAAVDALIASDSPVLSVAGKTGAVTLQTSDLSDFSSAVSSVINSATSSSVASLVNGTVPASQLPSYVDDVLEYSALVSFPNTGEAGKIYVDTTAKKIYRWSGSAYIEISPSPGSTDSVTEGSTNLYFTNARAADALQTTVNTLSAAIGGKQASGSYAAASHSHAIADVTGLQTALDGKQASGIYATTTVTTALSSAIDGKQAAGSYAAASHTHSTSDITGFSTAVTTLISAAAGVTVASLVGGVIPSSQLPSYVDDVLEYSALASFPGTGETGKIYVDTTTKKIYRWSGSAYVEISPSPGSTDAVPEGSTNLYYTNARASAAAPVQSVAGRTGAVTLGTSDISGFTAAASSAAPVQSVAGKTGTITLSTSDIQGLSASVVQYAPAQLVSSVAGRTGAVTLSTSDVSGLAATIATIPSSAQTTDWTNVATTYKGASASYLTSTNFTTVTATSLTLGTAMLSTYTTPVTSNGDFLVFTVNGKQRLIRVWDFN